MCASMLASMRIHVCLRARVRVCVCVPCALRVCAVCWCCESCMLRAAGACALRAAASSGQPVSRSGVLCMVCGLTSQFILETDPNRTIMNNAPPAIFFWHTHTRTK